MSIEFQNTPVTWNNTGVEPSTDLKENGFVPGYKPAADTFNFLQNNSSACLTELQTKLSGVYDNVTTLEGTVSELDENAVRGIRGSGTLITPMSDKTVNITPQGIGAATSSHNHSASNITSGTLSIARGGTGASSASSARSNLGVWGQTTLYSNTSGTTGTFTLSSAYTMYDVIGIYGRGMNDSDEQCYSALYPSSGNVVSLSTTSHQSDETTVWRSTKLVFSSTSVAFGWNRASSYSKATDGHGFTSDDGIRVTKVIGYKY